MKNITILLFVIFFSLNVGSLAENDLKVKRIFEGKKDAKITIIAYESLTCSHCADFHINVYPKLKTDFIDTGIAKIEFRHFPLDIVAFNASKLSQCNNDSKSDIMHILFSNQEKWVKGNSADDMNAHLKNFLKEKNLNLDFEKCIANKSIEDYVLNDRIEGQKKFNINSTPTIIINNEKFTGSLNYKNLKKAIESTSFLSS